MTTLQMPQLSDDMTESLLCAWLVDEGAHFSAGEALYEVETDKVVAQIEADHAGTLLRQLAEAGEPVPCGADVAEVRYDDR